MKIVLASATIVNPLPGGHSLQELGRRLLEHIEFSGRISHRSEDAAPDTKRFIKAVVIDHGDWSITEHAYLSVDAVMDRGITHEWVRHRMASYTQESTRFVNYQKKMPPAFVYPVPGVRCEHCLAGDDGLFQTAPGLRLRMDTGGNWIHGEQPCPYSPEWLHAMNNAERSYAHLIAIGWRPQEARSVFPTALAARIMTTANLRSWRHFFLSRTSKEAHPQIREIASDLLRQFQAIIPVLYDDIFPGERQAANFRLGR